MRLQKEREDIKELSDLRDRQKDSLASQPGNLFLVMLEPMPVTMNINPALNDPFVDFKMRLFNGSLFTVELDDFQCEIVMNGRTLPIKASLVNQLSFLGPGESALLNFRQSIQRPTGNALLEAVERRDKITWQFTFKCGYQLAGWTRPRTLSHGMAYVEIPFDP